MNKQAIKNVPRMSDICNDDENRMAFSMFLSCMTHSVMHCILQIKDSKDAQLRVFATFILSIKGILEKLGIPVTIDAIGWQRHVDMMAEECDVITDKTQSVIVEENERKYGDVKGDYGIRFQRRMYDTKKVDKYLEEMQTKIKGGKIKFDSASTKSSPGSKDLDASTKIAEWSDIKVDDIKGEC